MIQTNIISTINKILQWETKLYVPPRKKTKKSHKITGEQKYKPTLFLAGLRHKKYLFNSKKEVPCFLNEGLSDDQKMLIKHMAMIFVNSLLEM
jgi:hypothetical protein